MCGNIHTRSTKSTCFDCAICLTSYTPLHFCRLPCAYARTHAYTRVHAHAHTHTPMHTHTRAHTRIHAHTRAHLRPCAPRPCMCRRTHPSKCPCEPLRASTRRFPPLPRMFTLPACKTPYRASQTPLQPFPVLRACACVCVLSLM